MAKRGRKPTPILCYLSDWKERISDGPRSMGKIIRYRYLISASKYCWNLALEQEGYPAIIKSSAGCFRDLILCIFRGTEENPSLALTTIVKALQEKTQTSLTLIETNTPEELVLAASSIDVVYKTNFALPDDNGVRSRIFGQIEDESEEDEEE